MDLRPLLCACVMALVSPALPADYRIEANIHYDRYLETVLDILQPQAPALRNRPVVLVIHGGGWVEGDKESMVEEFCLPFIRHDFVVANVEYRLGRVAAAPAAVGDVLTAAKWVHDHAAEYKVDPRFLIAAGNSAGGHLALMAAMAETSAGLGPLTKLAAVIDFYGIADVADQLDGPNQRPYAVAWIPPQPGRMELAHRLSPMTYIRKGLPPVLAIHGDADPVVPYDQSVKLTQALKSSGDDSLLITVPGGQHGFTPEEMNKLWPQIFQWLKKHRIGF